MKLLFARLALGLLLMVVLLALGALLFWHWPRQPPPEFAQAELPESHRGLRVSWWGVTAILIQDDHNALMIDPFFSRPTGLWPLVRNRPIAPHPGRIQAGLAEAGVTQLDAVLVSHSHYDHAMDAGVVANLGGAQLLGSESTLNIGRGAGVAPRALQAIEFDRVYEFGAFQVRFFPSQHAGATGGRPLGEIAEALRPPARYLDYKLGGTYSILISHPEGRLLHHGSAGYEPGALQGQRADVVMLGVALIEDHESYLQQTLDSVGAGMVIPIHWDNFLRPLSAPLHAMPVAVDLPDWFATMARLRPTIKLGTLRLGQPSALPRLADNDTTFEKPIPQP